MTNKSRWDELLASSATRSRDDHANGVARVGGLFGDGFGPSYWEMHVQAARVLVDHARAANQLNSLARRCLYTQRHALELIIKDLLGLVCEEQNLLHRLGKSARPSNGIPKAHSLCRTNPRDF